MLFGGGSSAEFGVSLLHCDTYVLVPGMNHGGWWWEPLVRRQRWTRHRPGRPQCGIISGVADAQPDRVRALVYLDALFPEDGDSSWSMTNDDEHAWYVSGSARTGAFVDPPPFSDARTRPHPLATLMQASKFTGAWRSCTREDSTSDAKQSQCR